MIVNKAHVTALTALAATDQKTEMVVVRPLALKHSVALLRERQKLACILLFRELCTLFFSPPRSARHRLPDGRNNTARSRVCP